MDEKEHARFTAGAAEISREVEGAFVTNNGYSTGTNKELIQDTKSGYKDCPDLAGERLA